MRPTATASSSSPSSEYRFIEPLDVLVMRGNKLFGDPGSHGDSLMPPWPSAAAGALRTQLLASEGLDPSAFAKGHIEHRVLGRPDAPGSFVLTAFTLACQLTDGTLQSLHALPADLVVTDTADGKQHTVQHLRPQALHAGLLSSSIFSDVPVLPTTERRKTTSGIWLTQQGWQRYLGGQLPDAVQDLVPTNRLWSTDSRVGIGLNAHTRSADDGKLFTTQAIAFKPGVGFLATVQGAALPSQGSLRLGGDGRAASSQSVAYQPPRADLQAIAAQRRCRLVLTTPGLFNQGWLPNGFRTQGDGSHWLELHGVRARLICAAVARSETISGWDLAQWRPKAALRSAPIGSVYWLDELDATPESLGKLVEKGFWSEVCEDRQRRAEGFNRLAVAPFGSL
jgi:CRISPR-associated protein Cmr3